MDWLGKMLNLPQEFLFENKGHGGGVIQVFAIYENKVWQKYNVYIYYYGSYGKCIHYIFARLYGTWKFDHHW